MQVSGIGIQHHTDGRQYTGVQESLQKPKLSEVKYSQVTISSICERGEDAEENHNTNMYEQ